MNRFEFDLIPTRYAVLVLGTSQILRMYQPVPKKMLAIKLVKIDPKKGNSIRRVIFKHKSKIFIESSAANLDVIFSDHLQKGKKATD